MIRDPFASIRRRGLRIPALALAVMLTAAWAPCLACETPAHANGSPGLAAPQSCHDVGDLAAACVPAIRAPASALRTPGAPAPGAPVLQACPPPVLRVPVPESASEQTPGPAPRVRPRLYLLHESLLA